MIENVSSDIVCVLIRHKIIDISEASVYQYGFEIFISSLLTCLIAIICGLIFNCLFASVVYFTIFAVMRSICGGYHAKTYWQCNLLFAVVTIIVLSIFKFVSLDKFSELHICCIAFSVIVTAYYAPIENENKPLSAKQKKTFRILGTAMIIILAIISCVLKIKFKSLYSILIDTTLCVVAISMFVTEPKRGGEQK